MTAALHHVHLTVNHLRDFVATAADRMTNMSSLVSSYDHHVSIYAHEASQDKTDAAAFSRLSPSAAVYEGFAATRRRLYDHDEELPVRPFVGRISIKQPRRIAVQVTQHASSHSCRCRLISIRHEQLFHCCVF